MISSFIHTCLYISTWLWFYMHVLHSTIVARCNENTRVTHLYTEWLIVVIYVYNSIIVFTQQLNKNINNLMVKIQKKLNQYISIEIIICLKYHYYPKMGLLVIVHL